MATSEEFAANLRKAIADSKALEAESLEAVLKALNAAHADIVGKIASSGTGTFSHFQLNSLKSEIERAMAQLQDKLTTDIGSAQAKQFNLGISSTDSGLQLAIGTPLSLAAPSLVTLGIAQGYSATLVKGLTDSARAQLTGILQRAVLGGQSMVDIVKAIGSTVNEGAERTITSRALTIARTEILRMQGAAQQTRLEQASNAGANVEKMWFHVIEPNPRDTHVAMHGTHIGVDKEFDVDGESMLYPRDPSASAMNTVNCRCRLVTYVPGLSKQISAAFKLAA